VAFVAAGSCAVRIEGVPEEVHIAALPGGFWQDFADRLLEAGMVVADDKLDACQAAPLQPGQELAPARSTFPVGELDRQDLSPAVFVDGYCDQHRLADDDPRLAHLLVRASRIRQG
jgi:hypothetical protein